MKRTLIFSLTAILLFVMSSVCFAELNYKSIKNYKMSQSKYVSTATYKYILPHDVLINHDAGPESFQEFLYYSAKHIYTKYGKKKKNKHYIIFLARNSSGSVFKFKILFINDLFPKALTMSKYRNYQVIPDYVASFKELM